MISKSECPGSLARMPCRSPSLSAGRMAPLQWLSEIAADGKKALDIGSYVPKIAQTWRLGLMAAPLLQASRRVVIGLDLKRNSGVLSNQSCSSSLLQMACADNRHTGPLNSTTGGCHARPKRQKPKQRCLLASQRFSEKAKRLERKAVKAQQTATAQGEALALVGA